MPDDEEERTRSLMECVRWEDDESDTRQGVAEVHKDCDPSRTEHGGCRFRVVGYLGGRTFLTM